MADGWLKSHGKSWWIMVHGWFVINGKQCLVNYKCSMVGEYSMIGNGRWWTIPDYPLKLFVDINHHEVSLPSIISYHSQQSSVTNDHIISLIQRLVIQQQETIESFTSCINALLIQLRLVAVRSSPWRPITPSSALMGSKPRGDSVDPRTWQPEHRNGQRETGGEFTSRLRRERRWEDMAMEISDFMHFMKRYIYFNSLIY